jgi:hypothetical protein
MKDIGFKELGILAKRYGFNNILDFSVWVEDNNLANALGIKGEDEEEEIIEDTNSRTYKTKVLALEILSLPEVQKELKESDNISLAKWEKWAMKVRDKKIKKDLN